MTSLSNVLWVIQSNHLSLAHGMDVHKLTEFLDYQSTPYRPIELVRSDDSPIETDPWDGPVIFYGSTKLVERVAKHNRWNPGVYYTPERFSFEAFRAGYGDRLLNSDSEILTLGEFFDRHDPTTNQTPSELFIRPAEDMKTFVGGVRTHVEAACLLDHTTKSRATRETRVQVAPVKTIVHEWRTIIVDGRVITGSHYRSHGQQMNRGNYGTLPERVIAFSGAMAKMYQPAPVFVLDVGELTDGSLRVVECNTFNCSGLYWSDFYVIAREVTEFAASRY